MGRSTVTQNVVCIWYDGAAEQAASFYAQTFPDSAVSAVHRAPGDYPAGTQGQVLTVEFTVVGVACLGLNGGPAFKHSAAFSVKRDWKFSEPALIAAPARAAARAVAVAERSAAGTGDRGRR